METYSVTDLLDLPRTLVDVLHYFDGRPTVAVLDGVKTSEGIRLDPALVRQLATKSFGASAG